MNFEFNFKAFLQAENEAGQQWARLREEVKRLLALDDPRQLHPQFIPIEEKAVFEELVLQLGRNGKKGINPNQKAGEWHEYVSTIWQTYYEWTPKQIFQPTKRAF